MAQGRRRRLMGKAVSGQMVRNYLALLRLPPPVQELADAANLSEFRLRPVVGLNEPDRQLGMVKRIVEQSLSGRQANALVKEVGALAEEGERTVGQSRAKGATPRSLKRRVRSMVTYFQKQIGEIGRVYSFSVDLRELEEYR